jgi:hypothetical protein
MASAASSPSGSPVSARQREKFLEFLDMKREEGKIRRLFSRVSDFLQQDGSDFDGYRKAMSQDVGMDGIG